MNDTDASCAEPRSAKSHDIRPNASADAPPFYAAQAAADFLGIHRSTLYLAVRNLKLIPDAYTPGGHARFRRETLERFSDRLALDSATGGAGCTGRAVASAIASLAQCGRLEPVGEAVVDAALAICSGFSGCTALVCDDDAPRGEELRILAARGVSQRLTTEYQWLRRRPGVAFISATVVHTCERFICADVREPGACVPEGGRALLIGAGYQSCAAFPCVASGVTLGALICLGRAPCVLSEPETVALGNLAGVLAVALRRARREAAIERQIGVISALLRAAREASGCADANAERLSALCELFIAGTQARLMYTWPPAAEHGAPPASLAELLCAAATQGAPQRTEWIEDEDTMVALATPALGAAGGRRAFAALWRRQDMRAGMEATTLQVFAQVYAQIQTNCAAAPTQPRDHDDLQAGVCQ